MLPYEFVGEPTSTQITGHAGLLPYIDLACVLGVLKGADEKVGVCGAQGWRDRQHGLCLILPNGYPRLMAANTHQRNKETG